MFYRFLCARLLWGGVLCRRNGLPLRPYPFLVRCILLVSRCEYSCSFPSPRYDAGGDLLAINMVPGAHVRPSWVRSLGRASGPALPVPKGWGKRASLVTLSPRAKAFPPLRFRTLSVIFHGLDHCSRCIGTYACACPIPRTPCQPGRSCPANKNARSAVGGRGVAKSLPIYIAIGLRQVPGRG